MHELALDASAAATGSSASEHASSTLFTFSVTCVTETKILSGCMRVSSSIAASEWLQACMQLQSQEVAADMQ